MKVLNYFNKRDIALWLSSVMIIIASYIFLSGGSILSVVASLVGVTSLIFCAKGLPVGQIFMIAFCALYTVISYSFAYYGEMVTYIGMTLPIAVLALISWLRHPFQGNKAEVEVNQIHRKEIGFLCVLTTFVTIAFYYILSYFHTANIVPSTVSVTTSFIAAYLTFRRSAYFAIAYAANDVVLIVLWIMASFSDIKYISVVVCFIAFLVNDVYGFWNWRRMEIKQRKTAGA